MPPAAGGQSLPHYVETHQELQELHKQRVLEPPQEFPQSPPRPGQLHIVGFTWLQRSIKSSEADQYTEQVAIIL